ncbi:MAG TPA: glycosyltransferase [Kineosporiaceae bacterium]|nr:glycosyltransferase [Kineosporiaceae bacterium]
MEPIKGVPMLEADDSDQPNPADRRPDTSLPGRGRPVFLDASGRRWRMLRATGIALIVVALTTVAFAAPHTLGAPALQGSPQRADIASLRDTDRLPVVGAGPLVRLVSAVTGKGRVVARDAFSGAQVAVLTGQDAVRAADHPFLLQRYGYSPGAQRTISLTFDDGPDPRYTPQLLDLLSKEHVQATFFVIGSSAARYQDLVAREAREGHDVGDHSLTHVDLSLALPLRAELEMVWTDRIVRATTGRETRLIRLPYEGEDEQTTQDDLAGIVRAERLGYVVASHDFDSNDWEYGTPSAGRAPIAMPPLDGRNLTVLLHDGGGNRAATLTYVSELIRQARARGYTFRSMGAAQTAYLPAVLPVAPSRWDRVTVWLTEVLLDWPAQVLVVLLLLAGISVLVGLGNCLVAGGRFLARRHRALPALGEFELPVSIVIAAYNEDTVIRRTVLSVLDSQYPISELVVVNDGSTDMTLRELSDLSRTEPRLRVITRPNGGKATALNDGFEQAACDIIVTMDADTLVTPTTVTNLVRHFAADPDGRLAAVAGVIRVSNRTWNVLTRWQALEYVTQIGVERSAQDAMGAIAIVPGACAAWRKAAVQSIGGYSNETLAEDCDLTLSLHRAGWRSTQDDEAIAYTEVPQDLDTLLAQRTRWMFGTLQSIHKHRRLLFGRNGWLGWLVLPTYVLSIVMPILFLPLTTLAAVLMVHQQGWGVLGLYVLAFMAAQLVIAGVAVIVMKERPSLLLMVPVYRLVFEPLRAYLLYTSAYMAIRGVRGKWNKFARSGSVDARSALATAHSSAG